MKKALGLLLLICSGCLSAEEYGSNVQFQTRNSNVRVLAVHPHGDGGGFYIVVQGLETQDRSVVRYERDNNLPVLGDVWETSIDKCGRIQLIRRQKDKE